MTTDTILRPACKHLRAARESWHRRAHLLALDLEQTAGERELAEQPPHAEVLRLKQSGLVNLLIPLAAGGEGGTVLDAVRAVVEISRADASIGALLAFHYYVSSVPRLFDGVDEAAAIDRRSAETSWFWGNVHQPQVEDFVATPLDDGGFSISGTKDWNTGIGVADVTTVIARRSDRPELLFAVIPTDRDGLTIRGEWDQIGLRLAETLSADFDDVRVQPDEVLVSSDGLIRGFPPQYAAFSTIFYAAVFLGAARGAFERARAFTLTRPPRLASGDLKPWRDPHTLAKFGDAWGELEAVQALVEQVAAEIADGYARRSEIDQQDRDRLTARGFAARSFAAEVALRITEDAFEISGTDTTRTAFGLDRHWRDVRTLAQHDPLVYTARGLGERYLVGTPFDIPSLV